MFDASDPRSKLRSSGSARPVTDIVAAQYCPFRKHEPEASALARTWHARGQYFLVAYSEVETGARFERSADAQPDEHILYLPDRDVDVSVRLGDEVHEISGRSLAILPPGASEIAVRGSGRLIRFFTTLATDLEARCINRAAYAEAQPNHAEYRAWPAPPDGFRLRVYPLDGPMGGIGFARLYRSTNLMVMDCKPVEGPRDWTRSTAHQHDDFEQGCLVLEGEYSYHLRYPWVPDMRKWIEDTHDHATGSTLVVIPPSVLHTNGPELHGTNHVVDIYSPPRLDFSEQPGWVVNEKEYRLPSVG